MQQGQGQRAHQLPICDRVLGHGGADEQGCHNERNACSLDQSADVDQAVPLHDNDLQGNRGGVWSPNPLLHLLPDGGR